MKESKSSTAFDSSQASKDWGDRWLNSNYLRWVFLADFVGCRRLCQTDFTYQENTLDQNSTEC